MKIIILGLLVSFNLFAAENNVRPTICYTTADCVDTHGSSVENVLIKKCSGIEYEVPFKKYQVCNIVADKPFGYCELEKTAFEYNRDKCWEDADLP